jgi:putative copper resistance protein D
MSAAGMLRLLVTHWQAAWALDAAATLAAVLYLAAAARVRRGWPASRALFFLAGVGSVLVALQSGIGGYDDELLSVHMVQHMLLLLLAPVLLLGGRPAALALLVLRGNRRHALARGLRRLGAFARPLTCLGVFTVILVGTHIPAFYDATLRQPVLHDAEHVAYLVSGLLMWWPFAGADPVPAHRLGPFGRLVYMLALMPSMALIGAYLNRHASLFYPAYGAPAHALHVNAIVDQAQAGAIMWVVGSVVVSFGGLWSVMAALVSDEKRQRLREAHGPQPWTSELPWEPPSAGGTS